MCCRVGVVCCAAKVDESELNVYMWGGWMEDEVCKNGHAKRLEDKNQGGQNLEQIKHRAVCLCVPAAHGRVCLFKFAMLSLPVPLIQSESLLESGTAVQSGVEYPPSRSHKTRGCSRSQASVKMVAQNSNPHAPSSRLLP